MNREQDKHSPWATLPKHLIYSEGNQISQMLKWLAQNHMARCSLFHLSNKLWMEFLWWVRLLRWTQENQQYSQDTVSDLEAHTGTSVPNPVFIPVYHDGQSSLFSRVWEEWCSHLYWYFPLCISSVWWVKWDHISWPGNQNNYVYCCFHGKMHLDFKHPAIFTNFQTGECLSWKILAEIV